MGNSESKSEGAPPSRSTSHSSTAARREGEREVSQSRSGNDAARRGPSHGGSTKTAAGFLPQPSTSTSTSTTTATATVSASPSHSRARSITTGAARSGADVRSSSQKSDASRGGGGGVMGNTVSSSPRPPSRANTLPVNPSVDKEKRVPSPQPVDVPQPSHNDGSSERQDTFSPPGLAGSYGLPPSDFSRPPRLPLPIERDPEPNSPLITPSDIAAPVDQDELEGLLPRRASMLSSTTLDDEEAADADAFASEPNAAQKVPTTLEWKRAGRGVYVTGTFVNWERKFRLHKNAETGIFSATIPLFTGTHHLKFLVDGEMVTSDDLPTTVDWTNALVNYIEVVPEGPAQPPAPAEPIPIPGAKDTGDRARPLDVRTLQRASETGDEIAATLQDTVATPGDQGTTPQHAAQLPQSHDPSAQTPQVPGPGQKHGLPALQRLPRPTYTSEIPEILLHLDLYSTPENEHYQRASKAMQHLPNPPSLPMFMQKSILNATTPHKDDASVLTMPNHTVLNHLATSNIRSGVLATSGTTRYKRKFLTTIMYKPTSNNA